MEDAAIVDLYWQRSDMAISETEKKYGGDTPYMFDIVLEDPDAEELWATEIRISQFVTD